MAGGGGDVDSLLLGSDSAAENNNNNKPTSDIVIERRIYYILYRITKYSQVPVRFCGLEGWESGEVRLCRRPTSSEGEVGRDDTGGV